MNDSSDTPPDMVNPLKDDKYSFLFGDSSLSPFDKPYTFEPVFIGDSIYLNKIIDVNQFFLKIRALVEVWDANFGRYFESMGRENPRLLALQSAVEDLRKELPKT